MKQPQPPKYHPLKMGNKEHADAYGRSMMAYRKKIEKMKKSIIITICLFLFSGLITAQNVQVSSEKTKSGCFMKGVKPKTFIQIHTDTSALQDSNALYYDDMDITDSAMAPIVLAKRQVVMYIPRECASEYWFNIEGSTMGVYMCKGQFSICCLSDDVKYKGMYDFSIYVASDDALYNGRVQNGKVLYCFYIHPYNGRVQNGKVLYCFYIHP